MEVEEPKELYSDINKILEVYAQDDVISIVRMTDETEYKQLIDTIIVNLIAERMYTNKIIDPMSVSIYFNSIFSDVMEYLREMIREDEGDKDIEEND